MIETVAVLVALVVGIEVGRRLERRRLRAPIKHLALVCAIFAVSCSGSIESVRHHVQQASQAYQGARQAVADAMLLAARTAREAMDLELRLAGCSSDPTSQPARDPELCARIRWEHRDRLQAKLDAMSDCARAADIAARGALDALVSALGDDADWSKVVTLATRAITASEELRKCASGR